MDHSKDGCVRLAAPWAFAGVLLALWIPSFFATWRAGPAGLTSFIDSVGLGAFFWLLWFALWSRMWLAMASAIPFALIWPVEMWVRLNFGTPIASHIVAVAWETGWDEGTNFASAFGFQLGALALVWLGAYTATMVWAWRQKVAWRGRSRAWVLAIGLPLLLWSNWPGGSQPAIGTASAADTVLGQGSHGWGVEWENTFPVNLWVAVSHYRQQRRSLQTLETTLATRSLHATQAKPDQVPDLVVLVIGESASATHWGALGYGRDTTPRMARMPGAALFSDVVALSTATRSAVPNVLSRRPVLRPDGRVDLDAEPSLVKAFSEVGYQTFWFSNQAPLGRHDTSIGLYAHGADHVLFLNPSTYDAAGNTYDEALLGPLRRTLQQGGRQFIVVHLLGSHFDYAQRYPPAFDHFQPSGQGAGHSGETQQARTGDAVNNSYDNSIRYTDHILGEILDAVRGVGGRAAVAYFSDHGVDPSMGACSSQSGTRRSEEAYRVPVFVWLSEELRARRPEVWQRLQAHEKLPYTTRALYSTLLDLSSIEVAGGLPAESLLNRPSSAAPRMVAYGERMVDFDAARHKDACRIGAGG
ncbi:MAG: phosphoethanolamine transferase [Burkholderiaceae bacterium]|nr:phosphoethanolamine transferase [Burkholderiaceae bacterium]